MDEKQIKAAAYALAASIPPHLDKPTTPPLAWRVEGDQIRVILADGRGPFRGPLVQPKAEKIMALPTHPTTLMLEKGSNVAKSPAKHKAGK
jgi:hypothetical protein